MNQLKPGDYAIFAIYFVIISLYGYYVYNYNKKKANEQGAKDFFLAEGSLTWWAIGASLIASNISAEHFIGMSGSGFTLGLAISTYEWMAAASLIIVAVFFLPVYLKNKIYTMPQFLLERYKKAKRIIDIDISMFRSSPSFIVGSVFIVGILSALYIAFW